MVERLRKRSRQRGEDARAVGGAGLAWQSAAGLPESAPRPTAQKRLYGKPLALPRRSEPTPRRRRRLRWLSEPYRFDTEFYGARLAPPRRRVLAARVLAVLAVGGGAYYIQWRLSTLQGTGALGIAFYVTEALNYFGVVLTTFIFLRARWRTGSPAPPFGTLDVLIPVCGEPIEIVEGTLQAALAIGYPHETYLLNDGRLAGKANWQEIDALAERYGVPWFTRTTGTRGKAGNLNYALARTHGEFVAAIDADHQARTELAHETLGYFTDPAVGLICTPQQLDGDDGDSLNNRDLAYFRYMQASKDAADCAHVTGNGLYRRSALESIGGFSEWVAISEDVHTSYRLNAQGWKSVYHPRAVTTGLAPETASEYAKQRLGWTTDLLRMFFWDNPFLKRGLRPVQRLHYALTMGYFLITCTQVLFLVAPSLWLLWRIPAMHPKSTDDYLLHAVAYFVPVIGAFGAFGGFRGLLRVLQANLFMSPIHLLAALRAATGLKFSPRVTEKLRLARVSPLAAPTLAAFAFNVAGIAVALERDLTGDWLVVFWAGWLAFSISGFVTALVHRPRVVNALRGVVRLGVVTAASVIAIPGVLDYATRGPAIPAVGRLALAAPAQGAYVGVFNPDLTRRSDALAVWNRTHGVQARIVTWYQGWRGEQSRFRADWATWVSDRGAIPLITWEPSGTGGPEVTLRGIAAGRYDPYIRSWARAAAAYGRPILLRPMHDMNGSWYSWSIDAAGNSPSVFAAAWRHLHDVFAEEGATNVGWVWAVHSFTGLPAKSRNLAEYYPGPRYVDWVSMTGFNWGRSTRRTTWLSFDRIFGSTYLALARFGKPVMISEIGTTATGGDAASWIRDALGRLREAYPRVKAVVWFDSPYSSAVDFQLSGRAADVFRSEIAGSGYWRQAPRIVSAPATEIRRRSASSERVRGRADA